MLYRIHSDASQRNKEKQNTEKKEIWFQQLAPKYLEADGHLESVEGVISLLYTAASTAEKTMLFSVSYLIHKACLMVLILCIKK